jgi:ribonuclease HII
MGSTPGLVAGVDEAGRGPLAGPVVAAAVILDDLHPIRGLADSKALTPRRRERLFDEIRPRRCACHRRGQRRGDRPPQHPAGHAAGDARAVEGCGCPPAWCWSTATALPVLKVPAAAIVKGDAKVPAISAASILAKVHRDRLCADAARALAGLRLRRPQGLPHGRAPGRRCAPRALPEHRRSFAPGARRLRRVTEPLRISRATTRCWCACASWRATAGYRAAARSGSRATTCARAAARGGRAQAVITEEAWRKPAPA